MTIELRDVSPHHWQLSGLATTWSRDDTHSTYYVSNLKRGTFLERLQRGAFNDAIEGRDGVDLLLEHREDSPVFASTKAQTMKLADSDGGLVLGAALSKGHPATADAVRDIKAGLLKGLSVGMIVAEDRWGKAADGRTELRTITRANLAEVSMVRRPANHGATLDVRRETRSGGVVEYRAVALVVREDGSIDSEPDADRVICPRCGGTGYLDDDADDQGTVRHHRLRPTVPLAPRDNGERERLEQELLRVAMTG